MSEAAIREGLVIFDYLGYRREASRRLTRDTAQKSESVGITLDAINGGLSPEEKTLFLDLAKAHGLKEPTNYGAATDLTVLLGKIDRGEVATPLNGPGFTIESPRKIKEALVILDFLAYKRQAQERLSPETSAAAGMSGLVLDAIKVGGGLNDTGRETVKKLGRAHLTDYNSDTDLAALLKQTDQPPNSAPDSASVSNIPVSVLLKTTTNEVDMAQLAGSGRKMGNDDLPRQRFHAPADARPAAVSAPGQQDTADLEKVGRTILEWEPLFISAHKRLIRDSGLAEFPSITLRIMIGVTPDGKMKFLSAGYTSKNDDLGLKLLEKVKDYIGKIDFSKLGLKTKVTYELTLNY
jgi:hypothetical protein